MKIHWSNQQGLIVDILRDYEFHCVYNELRIKDDRKRLSEIRQKLATVGYTIKSIPCDGRGNHTNSSKILMRKIEKIPAPQPTLSPIQSPMQYHV